MKKTITVILKGKSNIQDPRKKIKKVAAGYAFNYLIPSNMAEVATKGKIKHLNMLHQIISQNKNLIDNRNMKTKHKLDNAGVIHIRKKCSQNKLIFGSIAEQDILTKLFQLTGQKIHKKQIKAGAIKQIGTYKVEIIINDSLNSILDLHVLPKSI